MVDPDDTDLERSWSSTWRAIGSEFSRAVLTFQLSGGLHPARSVDGCGSMLIAEPIRDISELDARVMFVICSLSVSRSSPNGECLYWLSKLVSCNVCGRGMDGWRWVRGIGPLKREASETDSLDSDLFSGMLDEALSLDDGSDFRENRLEVLPWCLAFAGSDSRLDGRNLWSNEEPLLDFLGLMGAASGGTGLSLTFRRAWKPEYVDGTPKLSKECLSEES
ncbi:hypothetical protein OGAPHI_006291 [Ogataea philodendri]|uniref:Uncharacterized protein n=1 Tax=Ogataea philodendri TaxID=1378263 RepID=A0A9P8NZ06_9ASCO|nr:uncharacterized protein OGAPHI_006291 [Ogataea philodendri]KAH3662110.1 hypothetical protein OGAPHI_006291 [Ogataea philodendri]